MSDILSTRQGSKYSEEDVRRVVSNCSKSRFALQEDPQTGMLQIRANQGHTMQVHTQSPNAIIFLLKIQHKNDSHAQASMVDVEYSSCRR